MRFEQRESTPLAFGILVPAGAFALSFVICAAVIAWSGVSPLTAYWHIFFGALGSKFAITETLTRTTPLIFTGLAVAVAFRARLWNIGAEGQLYVGAVVTIALGSGPLDLPGFVLIPVLIVCGFIAGALLFLGPAILKVQLGVDEVVTTLLLNFIIILLVSALLDGPDEGPDGDGLATVATRARIREAARPGARVAAAPRSRGRVDRRRGRMDVECAHHLGLRDEGHPAPT